MIVRQTANSKLTPGTPLHALPQHARATSCSSAQFARRFSKKPKLLSIVTGRSFQGFRVNAALTNGSSIGRESQRIEPLNVAFVSAEVAPWSKTGGLGDVVGGLPIELARTGHNVISISPRYDQHSDAWDTSVTAHIDGEEVRYFHTVKDGVDRVWVDHPWFLAKVWGKTGSMLYGSKSGSDYADNQKRFLLFNKAALRALELLPFGPGPDALVVANDWHTAILPVLVKEVYQKNGQYPNMKTALCIHNIAFQGRFWAEDWPVLGLPDRVKPLFDFQDGYPRVYSETEPDEEVAAAPGQSFHKLNWLRAGLLTADKLLTVSPNYAAEVAEDDEKGVELSGVVRAAGGLEGIVNGCDVGEWSPFLDKHLDVKYDAETMDEGKAVAKETLQAELGFEVDPDIPVFGFIGRLEEQKGVDILIDALPSVAREGGAQVVVLGTGKKALEAQVLALDKDFPEAVKGVVKFNVPLAHLITAGADFMLVPSRFEPCGLIQLHAMNYGTVPVVSSTGGLVDTVKDGVTGFHAGRFNPDKLDKKDSEAFAGAIKRAIGAFHTPAFRTMRQRCIVQELSWERPAEKWASVLDELRRAPRKATAVPPPREQRSVANGARPSKQPAVVAQPAEEARRARHPTPVQEVNREGDAVPQDAVARKAAATQAVMEQTKPKGVGRAVGQPAATSRPPAASNGANGAGDGPAAANGAGNGASKTAVPAAPSAAASKTLAGGPASAISKNGSADSSAGSSASQTAPLKAAASKATAAKASAKAASRAGETRGAAHSNGSTSKPAAARRAGGGGNGAGNGAAGSNGARAKGGVKSPSRASAQAKAKK